jgi:hypothetical protein
MNASSLAFIVTTGVCVGVGVVVVTVATVPVGVGAVVVVVDALVEFVHPTARTIAIQTIKRENIVIVFIVFFD